MSFNCIDEKSGQNKCPDKKNQRKVYCDTRTGKCYTATKSGQPHGFKKYMEEAKRSNESLVYDEEYKLFGHPDEVKKHIAVFQNTFESFDVETLQKFSLGKLKEMAQKLDPQWDTSTYSSQKQLISAIIRKQKEKQRRELIKDTSKKIDDEYERDELDKYDVWVNELSRTENPRLVEYIPYTAKILENNLLLEIKDIWG